MKITHAFTAAALLAHAQRQAHVAASPVDVFRRENTNAPGQTCPHTVTSVVAPTITQAITPISTVTNTATVTSIAPPPPPSITVTETVTPAPQTVTATVPQSTTVTVPANTVTSPVTVTVGSTVTEAAASSTILATNLINDVISINVQAWIPNPTNPGYLGIYTSTTTMAPGATMTATYYPVPSLGAWGEFYITNPQNSSWCAKATYTNCDAASIYAVQIIDASPVQVFLKN